MPPNPDPDKALDPTQIPGVPDAVQPAPNRALGPTQILGGPDGTQQGQLLAGQRIGKCHIQRLLGQGGMGAVYLARHDTLDIPVAIKIMPPDLVARHPDFGERFMREGRLAARLQHPNVVRVMDADRDSETGLYYIIQEYVAGGSLYERLEQGPLAEKEALQVVGSMAKALAVADKAGIIHRDIKPHNILISEEGRLKLADLGLARETNGKGGTLTQTQGALGTPAYMSPEQVRSPKHVDIRSDIYSLGATLYQLLTGSLPFGGESLFDQLQAVVKDPVPDPRDLRPELSAGVSALCMRMMAKQPENRFQTPAELLAAVKQPQHVAAPAHPARRPQRHLWIWAIAASTALVLITVVGSMVMLNRQNQEVGNTRNGVDEETSRARQKETPNQTTRKPRSTHLTGDGQALAQKITEPTDKEWKRRGNEAYENENWADAVQHYNQIKSDLIAEEVKRMRGRALVEVFLLAGLQAVASADYSRALDQCELAIEMTASAQLPSSFTHEARELLRKVLDRAGDSQEIDVQRARSLLAQTDK